MSDETATSEDDAPKKKGKKKLLLILIPVLLIGGGAGAYFGGFIGGGDKAVEEEHAEGEDGEHKDEKHTDDDHGDDKGEKHAKKDDHDKEDKKSKKDKHADAGDGHDDGGHSKKSGGGEYVFLQLPEIIVNLNDPKSRRSTYLKVKINLELNDEEAVEAVEEMMPRVVDSLQTYLRDLRAEDLQGSEGLYRLREELLHRVNVAVGNHAINDVLFAEMLMQ